MNFLLKLLPDGSPCTYDQDCMSSCCLDDICSAYDQCYCSTSSQCDTNCCINSECVDNSECSKSVLGLIITFIIIGIIFAYYIIKGIRFCIKNRSRLFIQEPTYTQNDYAPPPVVYINSDPFPPINPSHHGIPPPSNPSYPGIPPPSNPSHHGIPPPPPNPSQHGISPPNPSHHGISPHSNPSNRGASPKMHVSVSTTHTSHGTKTSHHSKH